MKIKDAAKMLGIPIETIRFYEKEGIVHPSRDENSGYRDYGLWDIFQLVACVNYRNTGMSVKEIARFLREGTRSDLLYFLNRSIEETQREINEKSQLQIVLQQFEKKLKYLPYNIGNYWVEDRDALCYVAGVQRNGSEYHQREGYWWREAEWIKKMPLTKSMQVVPVELLETSPASDTDYWCCAVQTDQMPALHLEKNEFVDSLPETLCITTVLDAGEIGTLSSDMLRKILLEVKHRGYHPYGTITSELIVRCWKEKAYHRFFEVMIPIQEPT